MNKIHYISLNDEDRLKVKAEIKAQLKSRYSSIYKAARHARLNVSSLSRLLGNIQTPRLNTLRALGFKEAITLELDNELTEVYFHQRNEALRGTNDLELINEIMFRGLIAPLNLK